MFPRIDKGPIEYSVEVFPAYSVEKQRDCIRFRFRTTEEFNHFQYHIAIENKHEKGRLVFALRGLKAKGLLPSVGVAETSVDLFDLSGSYDVSVIKPGDITNSFRISVGENGPRLLKELGEGDQFLQVFISNDK
ncbi:MAG: hypothetical protein IH600_13565 [Bacteroidetes bacterium]|nr:hypothetical protein [Bacteroidota bacterium]